MISQDVSLLHEISWILEAVGYKVQTSDEFDQDALWRRYSVTDFLIVDGRGIAEPTAATLCTRFGQSTIPDLPLRPGQAHRFFSLVRGGSPRRTSHAREPRRTIGSSSHRRTVSRIRAAAASSVVAVHRARHVFAARLPPQTAKTGGRATKLGSSQHALLVTAIDWYAGIRRKSGETASRSLVNTAARAIKRAAGENADLGLFRRRPICDAAGGSISRRGEKCRRVARQRFWQPREPSRVDPAADAHERCRAMDGG